MTEGRRVTARLVTGVLFAAALAVSGAARADPLSPDRVKDAVAQRYGVTVLKVDKVESAGKPAYDVIVMNPGGDSNGAFQVTRLMVDAETGALIPQYEIEASGYALPEDITRTPPIEDIGPAIRRLSTRPRS